MSFPLGLSMVEEVLQEWIDSGRPLNKELVQEALLEDFSESEILPVCDFWLAEYGCKWEWRRSVEELVLSLR